MPIRAPSSGVLTDTVGACPAGGLRVNSAAQFMTRLNKVLMAFLTAFDQTSMLVKLRKNQYRSRINLIVFLTNPVQVDWRGRKTTLCSPATQRVLRCSVPLTHSRSACPNISGPRLTRSPRRPSAPRFCGDSCLYGARQSTCRQRCDWKDFATVTRLMSGVSGRVCRKCRER